MNMIEEGDREQSKSLWENSAGINQTAIPADFWVGVSGSRRGSRVRKRGKKATKKSDFQQSWWRVGFPIWYWYTLAFNQREEEVAASHSDCRIEVQQRGDFILRWSLQRWLCLIRESHFGPPGIISIPLRWLWSFIIVSSCQCLTYLEYLVTTSKCNLGQCVACKTRQSQSLHVGQLFPLSIVMFLQFINQNININII